MSAVLRIIPARVALDPETVLLIEIEDFVGAWRATGKPMPRADKYDLLQMREALASMLRRHNRTFHRALRAEEGR